MTNRIALSANRNPAIKTLLEIAYVAIESATAAMRSGSEESFANTHIVAHLARPNRDSANACLMLRMGSHHLGACTTPAKAKETLSA